MRTIFINPKDQLRAGWRMLLFMIVFFMINIAGQLGIQILRYFVAFPSVLGEILVLSVSTATAFLASVMMLVFVDKRDWRSLGIGFRTGAGREWLAGALIGFIMLSVIALVFLFFGWANYSLRTTDWQSIVIGLLAYLTLYLLVAFHEEILFRGYLFQSLTEGIGPFWGTVSFSVLFGLAHAGNPNVSLFGLINITLAGILLSLAYLRRLSLWLPIGIHFAWNFTQGYIWGLPVSGTQTVFAFLQSSSFGPEWLTGGAFGPEGGLLCTLMTTAAAVFIWRFFKVDDRMKEIVEQARSIRSFPLRRSMNHPP